MRRLSAGLQWWNSVCKGVRESGRRYGEIDRETEYLNPPDNGIVEECIETSVAEWDGRYPGSGTPSKSLRDAELAFLRIQWMASYKKAKAA